VEAAAAARATSTAVLAVSSTERGVLLILKPGIDVPTGGPGRHTRSHVRLRGGIPRKVRTQRYAQRHPPSRPCRGRRTRGTTRLPLLMPGRSRCSQRS
jgi:hypothetical protein